ALGTRRPRSRRRPRAAARLARIALAWVRPAVAGPVAILVTLHGASRVRTVGGHPPEAPPSSR
ncbi:MAG: hypothetical protein L0I76_35910, partial [Pseudonocardia sp.]|nr:hypothetical protein [Pseudonocardia sp.]